MTEMQSENGARRMDSNSLNVKAMATITDMSLTLCEAGTGKRESVTNWGNVTIRGV